MRDFSHSVPLLRVLGLGFRVCYCVSLSPSPLGFEVDGTMEYFKPTSITDVGSCGLLGLVHFGFNGPWELQDSVCVASAALLRLAPHLEIAPSMAGLGLTRASRLMLRLMFTLARTCAGKFGPKITT